jgi:hypothetical protein
MMTRILAGLSLLICLAAAILFFRGDASQSAYRTALALGSVGWFAFAVLSLDRRGGK